METTTMPVDYDACRVLVVDDEPAVREAFEEMLSPEPEESGAMRVLREYSGGERARREGGRRFEVRSAGQGREGVVEVRRAIEEARPYAVAFIDVRMPPGFDGVETARLIRRFDEEIELIVVSAYSDRDIDEMQEAARHGLIFVSKPLNRAEVVQMARNACNAWDERRRMRKRFIELELVMDSLAHSPRSPSTNSVGGTEGVLTCTADGRVVSASGGAAGLLGRHQRELRGRNVGQLFVDLDWLSVVETVVGHRTVENLAFRVSGNDDDHRPWVLGTFSLVAGADAGPKRILIVIRRS